MATRQYDGRTVEVDSDGHLARREDWDRDLAAEIARDEGIGELTERHWLVLEYMRKVFSDTGEAPTIRRLTRESGVQTRELYELFPKGPAKKAAKVAGLPKPTGCI